MSNYCELTNLKTGQKISAKSVAEFCRKANLHHVNDPIHLYPILRGERLSHKNWCLDRYATRNFTIYDRFMNVYTGSLYDFLHRYTVSKHTLWALISGKKKICQGVFLKETKVKFVPASRERITSVSFKTPNNRIISGKSSRSVARQVNGSISYHSLSSLVRGMKNVSKGYTFHAASVNQRMMLQSV